MRLDNSLRSFLRALPRAAVLVAFCVVAACASGPQSFPGMGSDEDEDLPVFRYSGDPGKLPVGVIPNITIHDASRGKDIALTIEYPTREGPHPLIVFSHGYGGSNQAYVGLSSYWASQGFVVIKPSHADAGRIRDLNRVDDIWEQQTPADWANRVLDLRLVIDSLAQLEERFPELKGKIDHEKIGVGGHSYGAHTAMLIGGVQTFPGAVQYADPRVRAIVAMSPQGTAANRGFTPESYAGLKIPALFMTGSLDRGVTEEETPDWRKLAYDLSPAGDKWFVSIDGARHSSFAGRLGALLEQRVEHTSVLPGIAPDPQRQSSAIQPPGAMHQRQISGTIRMISLAFWDAYLRGDAKGREELGKATDRGGVTLEKK